MTVFKRIVKIILIIIIVLIVLGSAGAFALAKWLNPNDFKPQIVAMVDQATGRHLTLTGELSWNFFPSVGIHVGAAALSNPAGFTQANFAQINSADLSLSWSALLHGDIAVSSMDINGLQVFLRQNGSQNNWTFVFPTAKTANGAAQIHNAQNQTMNFSIDSLDLSNAQLHYDNDQAKTHIAVSNVNVMINQLSPDQAFPIALSGDVNVNDSLTGTVKLNTLCDYDFFKNTVRFSTLALQANMNDRTDTGHVTHLSTQISGEIDVNLNQQTVFLNDISFDLNQIVNGTMNLSVSGWSALNYIGDINLSAFSLPDLSTSLGMPFPVLPNKLVLQQVVVSAHLVGNAKKLSINPLKVRFTGTTMEGTVDITSFQPLRLSESVSADQLDASDFVNLSGAKLPMKNLAVSGTLTQGNSLSMNQNVNIQNLTLLGFDLKGLIDNINQMVTNLLNLRNVLTATSQLDQAMRTLQESQGSINAGNGKQTDLGSLKANIVMDRGVMTTPVMEIKGPLVVTTGSGQVDFNQKTIDYTLVSKLVAPGTIQGLVIPYKLEGPFNKMQQGVEWVIVQAEIVKYLSKSLGSTVTNSVTSVVGGAVHAIQGLFNH